MAEVWRKQGLKGKIKLVIFALIPAAAVFTCAEVVAGFEIQRQIEVVRDPANGQRVYTLRIGKFPWSRKSVTPLNALGFPDDEFSTIEPKGDCVHLVFSGDSFVFGDGVDRDSNFVELVKRRIAAENPGRCVRVFNVAERATTIEQQAQRVRETLEILQPDIVILGQYQNDLTDLTNPRLAADSAHARRGRTVRPWRAVRLAAFNVDLVRFLSYHAFGYMIAHDIRYDVLSRWSVLADSSRRETATDLMETYTGLYDSLVAELQDRGIAFGVIILPSKFDILAQRYPEEAFFVGLAEKHRIPYLLLFPALDANRSPYPYLMYDGHLNEVGNRVIATAVYDWLYRADPVPFPALHAAEGDADIATVR
jgi:lysophospholipase L1-like esterase